MCARLESLYVVTVDDEPSPQSTVALNVPTLSQGIVNASLAAVVLTVMLNGCKSSSVPLASQYDLLISPLVASVVSPTIRTSVYTRSL